MASYQTLEQALARIAELEAEIKDLKERNWIKLRHEQIKSFCTIDWRFGEEDFRADFIRTEMQNFSEEDYRKVVLEQ